MEGRKDMSKKEGQKGVRKERTNEENEGRGSGSFLKLSCSLSRFGLNVSNKPFDYVFIRRLVNDRWEAWNFYCV